MTMIVSENARRPGGPVPLAPTTPGTRSRGLADWLFGLFTPRPSQPPTPKVGPAILHVTHWKAGSQWLYKILHNCTPELIVPPKILVTDFLEDTVQPGKVYPTVYATREQFDRLRLPADWRRFVIIRDLRDTLISVYFSLKVSHSVIAEHITEKRAVLQSLSVEEGLLFLMEDWLHYCAQIQESWLASGERLYRYEDLLTRDLEILEPLLLDQCELPVSRERFREVVMANRFENLSRGRARGQEDLSSHERKGIAGDWRSHFTDRVRKAFKARFGNLLIATEYEKDLDW